MIFLINIGNTHIQVATMQDGEPVLLARYDTPALRENGGHIPVLEEAPDGWRAIVSSVVPMLNHLLAPHYGIRMTFLTAADFPQLDFSLMDVRTVGLDRICNAAAAMQSVGNGPVMVLDCGTCLVTEVVDSQRRFCGGAIMPGRMMLRRGLADYTAQLPLVPLQSSRPSPLGRTTHDAILAGTDLAVLGNIRHLVLETRQAINVDKCPVLTTGGDAPFFLQHLPELTPAPSLLTIRGIAASRYGNFV